ncbi:hypothetical protein PV325_000992 [Microctonus aethiopoides]|uniref:Mitochondrial splicing suppressor 51-like C-terminal domain-containing protein n=1 Tax=Microctonus aethiopoides TaxID=144406 RepID=A0AA39FJ84_9HYME|nr:hypothetical protein PV325_000992 [Microctonus aethiopoides]KAK0098643.1 hypothetical protein PV326_005565 [Microctonus aethiopoides]KAK0170450.1 hypothetical protein PV328_011012 [Microctonus aethiopoides]
MGRNKKRSSKKNNSANLMENGNSKETKSNNTTGKLELEIMKNTNQQLSISILDITSRLNLPLKPTGIDLSVDSDDDETLEFHIRPRFVYMCNLCLICMNICNCGVQCDNCQMVSYCSEQHREENKIQHQVLCRALSNICDGMKGFSLAKSLPPDLYRTFRIKTIGAIEKMLGRQLDLWEREIILYPRICRNCKKIDKELILCQDCEVDFFCQDHHQDHSKWCKDFQVFRKILFMQHKHGYVDPDVPVVFYNEPHVLPENFDFLMYSMFANSPSYRRIDCYTYASLSYVSTAPLTTLFAIQKTIYDWKSREELKIHIIGAEFQFECASLRVWEKLFLHFLPKLRKLSLEFTGPELYLPCAPPELLSKIKMCRKCKLLKRKIDVKFNSQMLYHKIMDENNPDLICLYNPGLYRETGFDGTDTWPCTIKKFCNAKVPVVVTSYTEFEIPRDIERIKSICSVEVLLEPQRNPFAAVKPDRNFVSDDVAPLMYKNYCISIVKGL